jgi:pimeloyl-ACP methyl ester carboxylesterase
VLSGQLDLFLNEAMPEIEKRIGVPKSRLIVGESMGGMNALTTGLIAPDRFRKIVALCPPLYRISPFSPWSEMLDFFRRTGGDPKTLLSVVELSKLYVENQAEWNRISPIKLIAALDPAHTPEIYLSCGLYDKYGNYEGAQDFAQTAIRRAFRIEWRPLFGGHCVSDVTSVAEAIAPSGLNLLTTTSR